MVRKYQQDKPITTGGAGYFPQFNQETVENIGYRYITGGLPISIVRQRLYNNLYPHGYNNVIGRFRNAVVNNKKDRRIGVRGNNENDYLNETRDPIFAEYLNIPEKDRHKSNYKLVESKYQPTIGKSGSKYYASPIVTAWREKGKYQGIISQLISSIYNSSDYSRRYDKPLNIGESRVGTSLSQDLGKHTISRGYDDKGEYVSYYDKWDLSPLGGSAGERDDSKGIGTPVSFYDRIYLDDYYGVKTPTHSTYLPEVIVKGRKHKFGGIMKAANARKWKHKNGGVIKAQEGTKMNWGELAKIVGGIASNAMSTVSENKKLNAWSKQYKQEKVNPLDYITKYLQEIQENNLRSQQAARALGSTVNFNPDIDKHFAYQLANQEVARKNREIDKQNKLLDVQTENQKTSNWMNLFGNIAQTGLGYLTSNIGKKSTNVNVPPSSTSTTANTATTSNFNNYMNNITIQKQLGIV